MQITLNHSNCKPQEIYPTYYLKSVVMDRFKDGTNEFQITKCCLFQIHSFHSHILNKKKC